MRIRLLLSAAILIIAASPESPGAEAVVNTYAHISADIPACKLRPPSWGKELREKVLAAIPSNHKNLALEFEKTSKNALNDPDPNACGASDVQNSVRYGDEVISGSRSVWDTFN